MNTRFDWWCKTAVDQIRYWPDRDAVYQELYAHLEDRYDAATDRGLTPEEAVEEALNSMGSASELAPVLGAIHRPYWGYILFATRCLKWIAVIAVALQLFAFFRYNTPSRGATHWYYENPGAEIVNVWADGTGESRRVMDFVPSASDTSDGFTFEATRAVMTFHDHYTDDTKDAYYFWLRVEVSGLHQWAQLKDIPLHDFWAVDSLGNTYCSNTECAYTSQRWVSGNLDRTGFFTYTMDMWLTNFCSQEAEWIELRYDRNGRDIRLRIELTGGEGE